MSPCGLDWPLPVTYDVEPPSRASLQCVCSLPVTSGRAILSVRQRAATPRVLLTGDALLGFSAVCVLRTRDIDTIE